MLAKNTPEKSRRFLAGLGAGIAAASLTLGLTVRSAAESARDPELRDAGNSSLQVPTRAASPTSTVTPRAQPPVPALTASATPSPKPRSAQPSPQHTASPTPPAKAQPPVQQQTTKPAAAPARTSVKKSVTLSGPTSWSALNAAISRIPGYRPGAIRWAVTARYGHYGTTDLATSQVFISPNVPPSLLDSVVRHEYAHVVTVRAYGGDWQRAKSALNLAYGGSGMTGVERAADCMAKAMGATWLHHTACTSSTWQAMARQVLAGRPV